MKYKTIFYIGSFILFLGILWMFLTHASHVEILNEKEETSHIYHVFQGLVGVIIGLIMMFKTEKRATEEEKLFK